MCQDLISRPSVCGEIGLSCFGTACRHRHTSQKPQRYHRADRFLWWVLASDQTHTQRYLRVVCRSGRLSLTVSPEAESGPLSRVALILRLCTAITIERRLMQVIGAGTATLINDRSWSEGAIRRRKYSPLPPSRGSDGSVGKSVGVLVVVFALRQRPGCHFISWHAMLAIRRFGTGTPPSLAVFGRTTN